MKHRVLFAAVTVLSVAALVGLVAIGRRGDEREAPSTTTRPATTTTVAPTTVAPTSIPPATPATPTTGSSATQRVPTSRPTTSPPVTTAQPGVVPAQVIRRGDPARNMIALTFDAGSDTGATAAILDLLKANGIPATFGLTGKWAHANPSLVARMAADGHLLVNHSYDHRSFTGGYGDPPLTRAERLDELARADNEIRAAAGVSTKPWFRPPYGAEDASVRANIALGGYRYELLWTLDSWGWKGVAADEVVRRCLDGAVPGAIVLMHVGAASTDYAALPRVIEGLRAKGYRFGTVAAVL